MQPFVMFDNDTVTLKTCTVLVDNGKNLWAEIDDELSQDTDQLARFLADVGVTAGRELPWPLPLPHFSTPQLKPENGSWECRSGALWALSPRFPQTGARG